MYVTINVLFLYFHTFYLNTFPHLCFLTLTSVKELNQCFFYTSILLVLLLTFTEVHNVNTFASSENNNGLCFCVFQSDGLNHICVFWDSSKEGGSWSPRGCTVEDSSTNRTICSCNHLSSFAVLMSLYEMEVRAEPWPHSWDAAVCFVLLLFFPDLQCDSSLWTGQVWLAADDLGGSVPLAGLPLPLHPDLLHDPLHQGSEDNNPPAPVHQPLCGHPHLPHVHLSHREQGKMLCGLLQRDEPMSAAIFSDTWWIQ